MKLILRRALVFAALGAFAFACRNVEGEGAHLCIERIDTYWTQVSCDSSCGACMQQCFRAWCPHNNVETESGCYSDTTRPDCGYPLAD